MECRDIDKADFSHTAIFHFDMGFDQSGRCVHLDDRFRLYHGYDSGFYRNSGSSDGTMTAHIEISAAVHKDDAEIGFRVGSSCQYGTKHVIMAPRFQHQCCPNVIEMFD